jgi:hypothetical protein
VKTYIASPKAARPKSAAIAGMWLQLPQVGRICGFGFSPYSLIFFATLTH